MDTVLELLQQSKCGIIVAALDFDSARKYTGKMTGTRGLKDGFAEISIKTFLFANG